LPIGDGSARHFYDAITSVGIEEQENSNRIGLCITRKINYSIGKRSISIEPFDKLVIDCSLDWHPNIEGRHIYTHDEDEYKDIAYARTFAEKKYVNRLKKGGQAKGTVLGVNTIDIDEHGKSTEYVKHKILDILGDLSLLFGFYIDGKVVAVNSGHELHHKLVREIINFGVSLRSGKRST
jgi:UDP-3-O-acyl-N-acetylglucosamine deacetylase